MQKNIVVYCKNNHQAHKLCVLQTCQYSSPICSSSDCIYSQIHTKCMFSVDCKDITLQLIRKKHRYSDFLNQQILVLYDNLIKRIQIQKSQFIHLIHSFMFTYDQHKLLKILSQGPTDQLYPSFVLKTINDLIKSQQNDQINFTQIKQKLQITKTEVQNKIKSIRQSFGKQYVPYLFDNQCCNKKYVEIVNNNRTIKNVSSKWKSPFAYSTLTLISPSVAEYNSKCIKLKIVVNKGYVFVGLAKKEDLVKSRYQWTKKYKGLHLIGYDGTIWNHLDQKEHLQNCELKFNQGDTIQMVYDQRNLSLTIKNVSNSTLHVLKHITNLDSDLFYCVRTYQPGEEVLIID